MKELYRWQINCKHTPETIDRILLPIRKRGICVKNLNYTQLDGKNASCIMEFETEPNAVDRIFKNMTRLEDIVEVIIL